MSETTCSPHDAAITVLRERRADLEIEERVLRGRIAELDEMIVVLVSRRPKVKKPRAADADKACAEPTEDARPSIFATPAASEDVAEAA